MRHHTHHIIIASSICSLTRQECFCCSHAHAGVSHPTTLKGAYFYRIIDMFIDQTRVFTATLTRRRVTPHYLERRLPIASSTCLSTRVFTVTHSHAGVSHPTTLKGAYFYRIIDMFIDQTGVNGPVALGAPFRDDIGGLSLKHDRKVRVCLCVLFVFCASF